MVRVVVSMASKDDPNVLETCLQTLCHLLEVGDVVVCWCVCVRVLVFLCVLWL